MAIPPKHSQKSLMLRLMRTIPSLEFDLKLHKLFLFLFIGLISFSGFSQRKKNIEPIVYCVKDLGNGMYQASFGYKNPTRKEVVVDENGSLIKSNKGKKVAKGLNRFKPGTNNKAFTKEFGSGDYVEWTIISNGKTHTVIANANSAKKCAPDDGFIFPVIGNGKSLDIIGQELTSLCDQVAGETPSDLIFQTIADKVLVEIIPIDGKMQDVISLLQGPDFMVPVTDFLLDLASYDNLSAVDVYLEKSLLCDINLHDDIVNFARPVYPAYLDSGGVVSQGDGAQTSNLVRESFRVRESDGSIVPVDGKGIKIGVMSDSYDMALGVPTYAALDVEAGELPMGVDLVEDNKFKASDEGRAMMQIIHDVAPGAELAFHTATASPRQFEVAFNALSLDCDIIVDDITFITEPFFGTGRISTAINDSGKFHFTSAGNVANKGYQSTFATSTNAPTTNFIDSESLTRAHLFDGIGGSDYLQEISVVPGTYLIALQWQEDVASQNNNLGAIEDLDIYIVDDQGRLLVGSNRVNIEGDPTEIIVFRATGTGTANILITSANGATTVPFRYIAFQTSAEDGSPDGLKFEEYFGGGAPTVSGHAMNPAPTTVTVGAVDYRFADSPLAESFSSYGGSLTDGITNLMVDLYAPDGGNTSVLTIGQDAQCDTCDKDGILNFYGTSASAPHAAAAMALLQSALPTWYPPTVESLASDPTLKTSYTKAQALATFTSTSTGLSGSAPSGSSAGLLNTLAAFKSIAAQTAKITELIVEDGKTPSTEPFTVTIIGEYFPENKDDVTILFDGQPLDDVAYSIGDNGETVITATVPEFSGNPPVIVSTISLTEGGDGEGAIPAYFFKDGKIALNVIADNAQFEYGQDISLAYTVEGLPEDVIFESLDLPSVVLNSGADALLDEGGFPIVFDYRIFPSFETELTQEQKDKYQVNFIAGYIDDDPEIGRVGYLTVTKKDLTITPEPTTYTYGDAIDLTLNYTYNTDNISNTTGFYNLINEAHSSDFYSENSLVVINKLRAVVNEQQILNLLDNRSWMGSDRVIQNKLRAVVNGMNLIDLEAQHFDDYLNTETDPITNKLRAVVNKLRAVVNGQDLINNNIDIFDPINNKLRAVVNGTGINNGDSFSDIFAVIDAEDGSNDTEERTIDKFYSINLLSAIEVVEEDEEGPQAYPGAFISPLSANFNTSYINGSVTFLPKELNPIIDSFVLPYGEELTLEKLDSITGFEGWAFEGEYKESEAIVFPEGVPYYFIKVDGDDTELELGDEALKERGTYVIKIRNPQNYVVKFKNDIPVTFTREGAPLSFDFVSMTIKYGETPVIDPASISGFAYDDTIEILEVDGKMPYYFIKEGNATEYTIGGEKKMEVGVYNLYLKNSPSGNYSFDDSVSIGTFTVEEATLSFDPTSLTIEYGVTPALVSNFEGFVHGEDESVLKVDGEIPYYFMKENDATEYTLGGAHKMSKGVYEMFLRDAPSDNYSIKNDIDRGKLTVVAANITVQTDNIESVYGDALSQADLSTIFNDFAYDETAEDVFGSSVIPYYLSDVDGEYEIDAIKDVGIYNIRIRPTNDNYIFDFDETLNEFVVTKAKLIAVIHNLVINQGETPVFISAFTGFIPGENVANVFLGGIPYYIVDEYGYEADYEEAGPYKIKIKDDRENYSISSNDDATLFINPFNDYMKKIRVYADCVVYNGPKDYTVTYRYENDNGDAIFIPSGPDNKLSGPAADSSSGELPNLFMPGAGTFEIRFNGKKLVWSLTSSGSTNKSSVSSSTTSDSGECDAKLDGAYTVYPNPVTDGNLFIKQNVVEESTVYILNMYGGILDTNNDFNGTNDTISIDMSGYDSGIYVVRIVSPDKVRTYNIIKQ